MILFISSDIKMLYLLGARFFFGSLDSDVEEILNEGPIFHERDKGTKSRRVQEEKEGEVGKQGKRKEEDGNKFPNPLPLTTLTRLFIIPSLAVV